MPNIIWIGNPFFSAALAHRGAALCHINCQPGEFLDWKSICATAEKLGYFAKPDLVVVADKSLPPFVLGVENFPCLTALYVVDSHIHSWFPAYAQAFDFCLVSLKDHLPNFGGKRLAPEQIIWSPPFFMPEPLKPYALEVPNAPEMPTLLSSPSLQEAPKKLYDFLFVGTVDARINPERVTFLEEFKRFEPSLQYMSGNYHKLYPAARLVLNHSIAEDLNFRVFEALGCGAALLTPKIGHGLEEIFSDGEDLFLFDQNDIPAAAAKALNLLNNPDLIKEVAQSGFSKVLAQHRAENRAKSFLELIQTCFFTGKAQALVQARLAQSAAIRMQYLKLIYLLLADNYPEFPILRRAYLAAATKSD